MEVQIDAKHYFTQKYNHKARWLSYWYQIDLVLETGAKMVLEVGVGSGTVRDYLKKSGVEVKILDIDQALNPDFTGSVEKIPLSNGTADCVLAAEVLEHLPFENFEKCLNEIKRVSACYAVISLPDARRTLCNLYLKKPLFPPIKLFLQIPSFKKHIWSGQHYWELGKIGYHFGRIEKIIRGCGWKILKSFTPQDVPTKHFFLLEKEN